MKSTTVPIESSARNVTEAVRSPFVNETRHPGGRGARRLCVLHCIGSLGGGGSERQLTYLARESASRKIEVHVAYVNGGPFLRELEASDVHLHRIKGSSNYDPRLLQALWVLTKKVEPHLIQTWLPQMDVLGGITSLITQTPWIMTERSVAEAHRQKVKSNIRRFLGSRAGLVIANSSAGQDYWRQGARGPSVVLIRNGLPVDELLGRPSLPLSDGLESSSLVLFAGRYSPEKNLLRLIEALAMVLGRLPSGEAVLVGDGPQRAELMDQIHRFQLQSRIRILDYTTTLWNWMQHASIFVSPSLFEGCPNAVLEAAICKCPLVLSDISAHREIFGSDAAMFVSPLSPEQIAEGIYGVLADPVSAKVRVARAYETAARLTVATMADAYISAYRDVLQQRQ